MRHILFLCTGNSARSIMAEYYMNHLHQNAGARDNAWQAWSAGSKPTGQPNPYALKTLCNHQINSAGARSKSWDEFAGDGATPMDVIITVCDNAAGETCPIWPAREGTTPMRLHWGFPDPAAATGSPEEISTAFETVFADIRIHIDQFCREQG